ncbi:MAG: hypothetical protein ACUVTZ_10875 [Armatimonadota bacterium]
MPDPGLEFLVEVCGCRACVSADSESTLRFLQDVLRPMICPHGRPADANIQVSSEPGGFALAVNAPAPIRTAAASLLELRHEVLIRLMELRPDILWLHAGGAEIDGSAVLACGPWGSGKSSLTTALCGMGWRYLSDDIVGIEPHSAFAVPFPIAPLVRLPNANSSAKRRVILTSQQVCRAPVPIRALVFVTHSCGAQVALSQCQPGHAALKLLQSCMNFAHHGERAVQRICSLVKDVPAYDLSFEDPIPAAQAIAGLCERS